MRRLLVLTIFVVIALSQQAEALVMCAPKRPTGTVREGAPIKLRTACKANELHLDPVALGLQGPPGTPGSGPVARDGHDTAVGFVFDIQERDAARVAVGTTPGPVSTAVTAPLRRNGFVIDEGIYFAGPDCTGQALVPRIFDSDSGTLSVGGIPIGGIVETDETGRLGMSGGGTALYFAVGPFEPMVPISFAAGSRPSDCLAPGTFLIPPSTCCSNAPGVQPRDLAPAQSINVGALVAPFRIDLLQ
jgi:hypothetical protein